ncbi:uncharacterized protein LOC116263153 [Nymphaea colorata]|nr:uncharacterized protein LOC116263153 [Nymphaea colorata]
MPTLRSATRRDPSLSLPSPGLRDESSSKARSRSASPASTENGTPPNSDGERKELAGSSPCNNPRGPACTRKSLRFASQNDEREKRQGGCDRVYLPSPRSSAGEPRSPDSSLSRAPASSSPAADKRGSASGKDESNIRFVPNDTCLSDTRRKSARLAWKGHEDGNGADSSKHVSILPVNGRNLSEKGDANDAGDPCLAHKRKVVGKKRLTAPQPADCAPSTADDAVRVSETTVSKLTAPDDESILVPATNPPSVEGVSGGGMGANEGETGSSHKGGMGGRKRNNESRGTAPLRSSQRVASKRKISSCPLEDIPADQGENSALGEGDTISETGLNHPAKEDGGGTGRFIIEMNYPDRANRADGEDGQSRLPVSPHTSEHNDGGRHDERPKVPDLNLIGMEATDVKFPADGVHTEKHRGGSCSGSSLMVSKGSASRTSVEKGKQIIEISDDEAEANGHDATVMGFTLGAADLDALCEVAERELQTYRQMEEENLGVLGRQKFPKKKKKQHPRMTRQENLEKARKAAPDFAYYKGGQSSYLLTNNDNGGSAPEAWPGPFSTALEIMNMRAERLAEREKKLASSLETPFVIEWTPSREGDSNPFSRPRPSLKDLCMTNLCVHIEDVTSFEGIPDEILIEIGHALCGSRRMSSRAMCLILRDSQVEVRILDCSNVTEKSLREAWFARRTFDKLKVLHLDLCGRCVSDNMLQAASSCFSKNKSGLTSLSLKGAYQLTDVGLLAVVSAAPTLSSVNLSDCSSLTEAGIYELADKLTTSLKELYIDGCQQLDAMAMLHSLLKLRNLEVLSVAGIQSVSDAFISSLVSVHGPKMKGLVLADCGNLTDSSIKAVAAQCSGLSTLSLNNLHILTDAAIRCLADGCRSIEVLTVNRCSFSDEAISVLLAASGQSLTDFSANGVKEVAHNTALSIASCCTRRLVRLDLSWCRKLTDEALGLIADSCVSLRELKLFGCTQVTAKFLDGHSNLQLQIIGLGGNCLIPKDFATPI